MLHICIVKSLNYKKLITTPHFYDMVMSFFGIKNCRLIFHQVIQPEIFFNYKV
jgi:hypothetical protein